MKYKLNSNISDINNCLEAANKMMDEAFDIILEIQNLIEDDSWQGEGKDVTLSLIELCRQYHEKLLNVANDNLDEVKSLESTADEFMRNEPIVSSWR